ncbi:MAG: oligosaccharide flippase family protein [Bacilli bacterium]
MTKSRTINTVKNINSGLINKGISIILLFVNRTALLQILGTEFVGLSGLITSIIATLSIVEMGFNSAIVYSLYKPISERNTDKICEIVSLFRKIYYIIGTIILVIGVCIMPFLPYLIYGNIPQNVNIYIVFGIYLLNTVISYYLFAYKESLIIADQRQALSNNIRTIVLIIVYISQLIILVYTRNFYYYLITLVIGTIITNLMIQLVTIKNYSFYKTIRINQKIPSDILLQVKGLMVDRVCDTFRNSFDGMIISSLMGLTVTAIYGNYYYIYSALYTITLTISNAMGASVGNSIVERSIDENYDDMMNFSLAFSWIVGWFTICLVCLYQPFMKIWVGEELMLSTFNMVLFCIYFYAINMNSIRNQYISGTGMWWKLKYSYAVEAIFNLLLNFILGYYFGISGVLCATIFTIIAFNYVQRNYILFKNYFCDKSIMEFQGNQLYYIVATIIGAFITYYICSLVPFDDFLLFFIRVIICIVLPNIIFYVSFSKMKRFKNILKLIKRIFKFAI